MVEVTIHRNAIRKKLAREGIQVSAEAVALLDRFVDDVVEDAGRITSEEGRKRVTPILMGKALQNAK